MPRFCANISTLFAERPFAERVEAAARAGFAAVEMQFPYAHEPAEIAARLRAARLEMVLHNLPAGDWAAGERGIAALPNRVAEFRDGVGQAIDWARTLGCRQLNCLAGVPPASLPREAALETLAANLRFAADALERHGIRLLVEALNARDVPGFLLSRTDEVAGLLDAVGSPNLFIQFDCYHAEIMEENIGAALDAHRSRIAHVQISDVPGRGEPGTGRIDWPALFRRLDAGGYRGWVGCEYNPVGTTEAGLGWRERLADRRP